MKLLIIGMLGAGKSTFAYHLTKKLMGQQIDPAQSVQAYHYRKPMLNVI